MCNPDFDLAGQAMQRYLECKRDCISGTSSTVNLPVKQGQWWWGLARKGTLVHTYPKGSDLFTTVPRQDSDREVQERRIIGPTPWPGVVIRFE